MILEVVLDQVRNILIQNYYDHLGLENVFNLWWLGFYFENIGISRLKYYINNFWTVRVMHVIFNIRIATSVQSESVSWRKWEAPRVLWTPRKGFPQSEFTKTVQDDSKRSGASSWIFQGLEQHWNEDTLSGWITHSHHCDGGCRGIKKMAVSKWRNKKGLKLDFYSTF